jgi:hypothetical protein
MRRKAKIAAGGADSNLNALLSDSQRARGGVATDLDYHR